MSEQLSGYELDYAIARALGYRDVCKDISWLNDAEQGFVTFDIIKGWRDGYEVTLPMYHVNANAQLALCAERGWRVLYTYGADGRPQATMYAPLREFVGRGGTWEEVGARALLAALTAGAAGA
jgi:hypothetical protein